MNGLRQAARDAHRNGLCVIPAAANGTKQPWPDGPKWTPYKTQQPTADQIDTWFANGRYDGMGVVCGRISGGLEMLEFEGRAVAEGVMDAYADIADASNLGPLWRQVTSGYMETTPSGGYHLLYRVIGDKVAGNTELASRPRTPDELAEWKAAEQAKVDAEPNNALRARRQESLDRITRGEQKPLVLIETRGEGGFVIVSPSTGRTHPSGGSWALKTGGYDSIPILSPEERDALHNLAAALDQMPAKQEDKPPPAQPHRDGHVNGHDPDGLRPGADYNARATWDEILLAEGWTKVSHHGGVTYWRRPGKDRGISATTGRNGADNLYVFSTSTVFEAEKPYSKFAAYTLLTEGSTSNAAFKSAGRKLRAAGYGSQTPATRIPGPPAQPDVEDPGPPEPDDGDPGDWQKGPVRRRGLLPDDFWNARPVLLHIRRAAHARARSGDIVLGGLLARLSSLLPPELRADTGVGSPASMNQFVILLGPSGSGKSSAAWIPRKLLPAPARLDFLDELPLGTGEGIAEAFMGEREVETGEVVLRGTNRGDFKTELVRMQIRHNALFYADEGESLTKQLFGRKGATVGESLRRAWTGGTIGQFNGQKVNTRVIPEGSYSLGIVVGFQPETALPLIEDAAAGTPQRFLWVSSTDPAIPEDIVDDPGPLDLALIRRGFGKDPKVRFAAAILRQIRVEDRARATGELRLPPLDSHKPLMLVKTSVLLAILDDRLDVIEEDWQLATVVWDTSTALRDHLVEYGVRQTAEEVEKRTRAHVDRELRTHQATAREELAVERVGRNIAKAAADYMAENDAAARITRGELHRRIAHRDREKYFARGLEYAEARGWVVAEGEGFTLGDSRPS